MDYKFEVVETAEQPVLSIKAVTSAANLQQDIGNAYDKIKAYLKELGEDPSDAPFAAYFNMDMEKLEVEMGFPVSKKLNGKDNISASVIPPSKMAICIYKGSYTEMKSAYDAMSKWMEDNRHIPSGVVYEFYYNSPLEVPESELLTKICFILK
ncbi:MAG TPA: GyrI-like domain-containing protein [Clostridia bacterium]